MKPVVFSLIFLAAGSVSADPLCDDLWFTRNVIFDRAGYCFGSELGASVFYNGDCTTSAPEITPADQENVARIRAAEQDWDCAIDSTVARSLSIDAAFRLLLSDQPVATGYESGCIGWQANPMPLRAGHSPDAPVVGQVQQGDNVNFGHEPVAGWEYLRVYRDGEMAAEGWADWGAHDETRCKGWAG